MALLSGFIISLLVSTVVILLVTKVLGETEGFFTALIAALAGSFIYGIAFYFLGAGILVTLLAGIAWLIALSTLYDMGWLKSLLIAIVISAVSQFAGLLLPTLFGPL